MAATQSTETTQFVAGEDMTDWQYKCVTVSTTEDKTVLKADAAGDADAYAFILQNKPRKGEGAAVAYSGRSLAVAGGAISRNAELRVNGSGKLIARGSNAAFVNARAVEAATADDQVVEVEVIRYYRA